MLMFELLTCLISRELNPTSFTHHPPPLLPQVMKMMMTLLAPASGRVRLSLPEGSVLKPGELIAGLDLDDPASILRAEPASQGFPELGPPCVASEGVDHAFNSALDAAHMILAGEIAQLLSGCNAWTHDLS